MLFLRLTLMLVALGFLAGAVGMVAYDIFLAFELDRLLRRRERRADADKTRETVGASESEASSGRSSLPPSPPAGSRVRRVVFGNGRWRLALKFLAIAAISGLAGKSIVVVSDGEAGVRISQVSGVLPGTLYPG